MTQVSTALNKLGINNKLSQYTPKNPKHSTTFIVQINKKEDRKTYQKLIGFWHSKKTIKLKNQQYL